MPIGFVSSPMLSDIFLKDVDERFGSMEGISYTRYADDFIISSAGDGAEKRLQYVLDELTDEIKAHQLALNKKKTYFRHLRLEGDAIHILGLNLVRTAGEINRITVSDRFIRETSIELCQLMLEKEQLSDWEARKRFCAVMGKVGYITYASEQSVRKLQKMLQVKTGKKLSLDYKNLQAACMRNPSANAEYQQRQYYTAYTKAIDLPYLPNVGLAWERASVCATTEKEKVNKSHTSSCKQARRKAGDILTEQEQKVAHQREHSLGSLKYYIMGLCRAAENNLHIRNVRLTIGSKTVIATSNADVQALREQARKIRNTQEAVSFYAQYQYTNPTKGTPLGNILSTDGSYRPLLCVAGGVSRTMDSCAICDTEGRIWMLANQKGRRDAHALTECNVSILRTHEEWQGNIQLDAYWPLATDEPAQTQIHSLLAQLPFVTETDSDCRTTHSEQKLQFNAEQAIFAVNTLRELSAVIRQADGELQLECTLFPAGYLESVDEKPLTFLNIDGGKSGIVSMKVGIF